MTTQGLDTEPCWVRGRERSCGGTSGASVLREQSGDGPGVAKKEMLQRNSAERQLQL